MKINEQATNDDVRICRTICEQFPNADALAREHTSWPTLLALVVDEGGIATYRPTLDCCSHPELIELANAYDAAQYLRGDARVAYRSGCMNPECRSCAGKRLLDKPKRKPRRGRKAPAETAHLRASEA